MMRIVRKMIQTAGFKFMILPFCFDLFNSEYHNFYANWHVFTNSIIKNQLRLTHCDKNVTGCTIR